MEVNVNNLKVSKKRRKIIEMYFSILITLGAMIGFGYWWNTPVILEQGYEQQKDNIVSKLSPDDVYNKRPIEISSTTEKVKIAFLGDTALTNETKNVFKLIRDEKAEVFVSLGDFDHVDKPDEWSGLLDAYLGKYFPVIAIAGNHDEKLWNEYSKIIQAKISQFPKGTCTTTDKGNIGLLYECTIGPVHIVLTTPDINIPESISKNASLFIRDVFKKELLNKSFAVAGGDDNSIPDKDPWRICAWHKTNSLMQLGNVTDKITWDTFEECRRFGAYIFVGHDHVYARSNLITNFPGMIVSTSSDNTILLKPGQTGLSIVGLGGMSIRPKVRQGDLWWANTFSMNTLRIENKSIKNTAGAVFCTFDKKSDTVPCYFKTIDGVVRDRFEMKR